MGWVWQRLRLLLSAKVVEHWLLAWSSDLLDQWVLGLIRPHYLLLWWLWLYKISLAYLLL